MSDAWLFDAYPHPSRSAIVLWIKHEGKMVKRLVPFHPSFCVAADELPLSEAESLLAEDPRVASMHRGRTRLWLRGPLTEVLRVTPKRMQDTVPIATDLRRATHTAGFLFFDVDHAQECRWMHAQGLWSMCRLDPASLGPATPPWPLAPASASPKDPSSAGTGPSASAGASSASTGPLSLRLAPGEDRWSVDYPDPDLRAVRLAVQCDPQGHVPAFTDPLVSIRFGDDEIRCPKPGDNDAERATIRTLGRLLRETDPDVLVTKHGDRFDIPYLLHKIDSLGLRHEVTLGRAPDPEPSRPDQAEKSIHTYGRWLFKTHAYYLRGRWHIDLSKKTLDSEDDRKDLHGIVYLARTSNRRAQDVNRNGAGFALQQMQIDHATDLGVALPWKRNLSEDWKDAATLCAVDRGGQIMVPKPGIYEDVAACDFSGYYPSLVVRHNLSSDTMNCACCPDGPVIPELGYHVCMRVQGHQAEILRRLWGHRRWAKAVLKRK